MEIVRKIFIIVAFFTPLVTGCDRLESDASTPPAKAAFDSATFDKSSWE